MADRSLKTVFLVFACLALLMPLAAAAQPPVITVSGSGTPTANGANLWNALAAVRSPDGLVKLEPGIYDLGTLSLVMRNGVDVEGSGRGTTTILTSAGSTPIVFNAGVRSELREVRVENNSLTSANLPAVYIASDLARLSRVDVHTNLGWQGIGILIDIASPQLNDVSVTIQPRSNDSIVGIYSAGGAPTLENVKVAISGGGSTGIHRGVVLSDSAAAIDGLTVVGATGLNGISIGVSVEDNSLGLVTSPVLVKIRDAEIRVSTPGNQAFAVAVSYNQLELRDSQGEATNSGPFGYAAGLVGTDDTIVNVFGSQLRGSGIIGYGVTSGSALDTSSPAIFVHHSVVEGSTGAYDEQDGSISFGASQLIGTSPGTATCASSYDGAFNPVSNGPC